MDHNEDWAGGPDYGGCAPDAHGHAALLLVESLIHGLVGGSVIALKEAVDIADVAVEVNAEILVDGGKGSAAMGRSHQLLQRISDSLKVDLRCRPL